MISASCGSHPTRCRVRPRIGRPNTKQVEYIQERALAPRTVTVPCPLRMDDTWDRLSPAGRQYLERIDHAVGAAQPATWPTASASLVDDHDRRRRRVYLNMNAAESTMSHPARRLLDSELATRVCGRSAGRPHFPRGTAERVRADELEALIVAQARRLFRAEFVEWRATSTTMANTAVLFALTKPGDALLVQSMDGGGNMSYHDGAIPSLRGLVVKDMPIAGTHFEIDIDGVRRLARQVRPAMLVVGGSYVLFPYPVGALRQIADEVGAILLYDAAHVALLIAAGLFQDPLREGGAPHDR